MSARTRELPRRSCLSVPGSSEKMLAKAPGIPADMVFVDLEDSVAPAEKAAARANAVAAVREQAWDDRIVCVRVNAWDSPWTAFDVLELVAGAGPRLDEVMLPKCQSAAEVTALDLVLAQAEHAAGLPVGSIGIEVQIETAVGMLAVEAICAASPRLEAVILGPADLAASLEMPLLTGGAPVPEYPGDHFHFAFTRLLLAGRANGLQVIDGPYLRLRDPEGLRAYSERTRVLGFDGKWAVHPDQVPVLNEVFSPTQEQFDRARALLDTYRQATEVDGRGAVWFGDEMIDEASRKMALKLVTRGARAGLTPSAS
jgi:citrate lyase subunit beta/citryl-CoA lyase